jgi:hypothetical protein
MTGRPCKACSSPQRNEIEAALAGGESVSRISRQFSNGTISSDAITRHWFNHVAKELRDAAVTAPAMDATDILSRLTSVADRAREISDRAFGKGNDSVALRGGDAESRALSMLAERGIRDTLTPHLLDSAKTLFFAVKAAADLDPAFALAVAAQLRRRGDIDNAEDFEALAASTLPISRNELKAGL